MRPQASHLSALTTAGALAPRPAVTPARHSARDLGAGLAALPATVAHAADATWLTTQPSNDNDTGNFHNAQHWG